MNSDEYRSLKRRLLILQFLLCFVLIIMVIKDLTQATVFTVLISLAVSILLMLEAVVEIFLTF